MGDVCACEISGEPGGGTARCMYHAAVIREHQQMYHVLRAISLGTLNAGDDPSNAAGRALLDVKYRH